jgi:hypothetical protein
MVAAARKRLDEVLVEADKLARQARMQLLRARHDYYLIHRHETNRDERGE